MGFWFDIDSTMILFSCGENTAPSDALPHTLPFTPRKDQKLATALDSTGTYWRHDMNHSHYVAFDLGKSHYITNFRGILNVNTNVKSAHFYVTDDYLDWGDPVLFVSDWQDYTPTGGYRYDVPNPKLGRYVLLVLGGTTDPDNYLRWG